MEALKVLSYDYSNVNTAVLKDYVKSYYALYFKTNEKFYLFKKPVDLSSYTNNIVSSSFTQYGFNMLLDSKRQYFLQNEVREKALKFLGEH